MCCLCDKRCVSSIWRERRKGGSVCVGLECEDESKGEEKMEKEEVAGEEGE